MIFKFKLPVFALCAVAILATAVNAHADFINVFGWRTTEAIVNNANGATLASLAKSTCHDGAGACTTANADVTFTTSGIGFDAPYSTIEQWIASNAFPINNLVDTVSDSLMDPTIWLFTGNASFTSSMNFTIAHDDGTTFIVNGLKVINDPGPTAPKTTSGTYTGDAGGSLPFTLIYTDCCSGNAVLKTTLIGPSNAPVQEPVPEPATLLLLGGGLMALAALSLPRKARRMVSLK